MHRTRFDDPPPSPDQKRMIQAILSGSLFITGGALGADDAGDGLLAFAAAIVLALLALGPRPLLRSSAGSWIDGENPPETGDDERR